MTALREARFAFDGGICQGCFHEVDPNNWHLAHIKGKRMWGDSIANVRVKHPDCHIVLEHNPKSVPPKDRT